MTPAAAYHALNAALECRGHPEETQLTLVPLQIGGVRAPSPVGELGNVEMTQAITLVDSSWQVVGPDVLLTGAVWRRLSLMRFYGIFLLTT